MAVKKKFPYRSAVVACNGGCRVTAGDNGCKDGCIGCGACVEKCKFGAISLNEYGVAEIDEEKCIGCGSCGKVCPQKIIHVHECANWIVVKCSNKSKGAEAKKQCEVSCIGCGICTTKCEFDAIHLSRDIPAASNMYKSEDKMKAILPYALKRQVKIIFNKDKSKK